MGVVAIAVVVAIGLCVVTGLVGGATVVVVVVVGVTPYMSKNTTMNVSILCPEMWAFPK